MIAHTQSTTHRNTPGLTIRRRCVMMLGIMIGIIGGTGLYQMDGLTNIETREMETPFGSPSAPLTLGRMGDRAVAFLPRHGLKHQIMPSEINFRANLWALKAAGVKRVIGVSAVGSLQLEIAPGDLALPDQYIDFTKGKRAHTFSVTAWWPTSRPPNRSAPRFRGPS